MSILSLRLNFKCYLSWESNAQLIINGIEAKPKTKACTACIYFLSKDYVKFRSIYMYDMCSYVCSLEVIHDIQHFESIMHNFTNSPFATLIPFPVQLAKLSNFNDWMDILASTASYSRYSGVCVFLALCLAWSIFIPCKHSYNPNTKIQCS